MLREVRGNAHPSSGLGAKESCSRLLDHAGASTWDPRRGSRVWRRCSEVCVCKNSSPGSGRHPAWINKTAVLILLSSARETPADQHRYGVHRAFLQSFLFLPLISRLGEIQHRNCLYLFIPPRRCLLQQNNHTSMSMRNMDMDLMNFFLKKPTPYAVFLLHTES